MIYILTAQHSLLSFFSSSFDCISLCFLNVSVISYYYIPMEKKKENSIFNMSVLTCSLPTLFLLHHPYTSRVGSWGHAHIARWPLALHLPDLGQEGLGAGTDGVGIVLEAFPALLLWGNWGIPFLTECWRWNSYTISRKIIFYDTHGKMSDFYLRVITILDFPSPISLGPVIGEL